MTWQGLADMLGAAQYQQHAICLTNDPILMILYVAADLTTWVAYSVIGLALLVKRAEKITLSPAARGMFGAFIFLCGLSHLTMVLTLFVGVYRLDIMVRVVMAAVSAVTAVFVAFEVYGFRAERARS